MSRKKPRPTNTAPRQRASCELPACESAVVGRARICAACTEATRRRIRALPTVYDDCAATGTERPDPFRQRVSGTTRFSIGLDTEVLAARTDIVDVLGSWCALVRDDRGVPAPQDAGVPTMARFLAKHLNWLATHPAAADLACEIADLTEAARHVVDHERSERIELGTCAEPGCGSSVYATIHTPRHPDASGVTCTSGHQLPPRQWLVLRRWRQQARAAAPQWTDAA